jgi:hypothetical protein
MSSRRLTQAAELRLIHPHERHAVDRADVHTRARDFGQCRSHQQIASGAFQLPAKFADTPRRHPAGHGDHIDVEFGGGLRGLRDRADDRHAECDLAAGPAAEIGANQRIVDTGAHDNEPRLRRAAGDVDQVTHRLTRADHQDLTAP